MVTLACMTIGTEVRRRRLALGLTLDDLAERSGLSPHYLSTLENDRRDPHLSTVVAVAKALRVAPGDLLGSGTHGKGAPSISALYECAPADAQDAITTLLTVIAARPRKKPTKRQ